MSRTGRQGRKMTRIYKVGSAHDVADTVAYWPSDSLLRADLSNTDLRCADLAGADLSWSDLSGSDLTGADLRGATLYMTRLDGADISLAMIDATTDITAATMIDVVITI